THWLDRSLLADYYLLSSTRDAAGDAVGFSAAELDTLAGLGGVVALSRSRTLTVRSAGGDIAIRAAVPGPRGYGEMIVAGPAQVFDRLDDGPYALASEPFATRRNLSPGATLALPSPAGEVTVTVLAIYRDYRTSDNGLLMNHAVAESLWGPLSPTGVGVYAAAAGQSTLGTELQRFADARAGTAFAENGAIRQATLTVFDRTFEVTAVLRLLAATVAFFGILSALSALQYERRAETATLRALGFRRRDVRRNTLAQSAVLGATAGVLALPLGVALAALLVVVINQRSYGWSMSFTVQPGELAVGFALALAAAVAAGLLPARQLARQPVAAGLRAE
ncbi:MAG: FtsX-like permease family protein, partial [Pseudomonadota bacterium]